MVHSTEIIIDFKIWDWIGNKDYDENVHIDNVKLTFNNGSNPDSIIKNFEKVNIPLHLLCQISLDL